MLKWAIFTYIGVKLNLGVGYYIACGIGFVASVLDFGMKMFELGEKED